MWHLNQLELCTKVNVFFRSGPLGKKALATLASDCLSCHYCGNTPPPLNTKQNIIYTYVRYVCSYVARNRFINRAMKNTAYRAAATQTYTELPYCRTALDFVFVGSLTFCLISIHNHHVFFSVMGCNHSRELIKCASTVMLRVFIFN